MKCYTIRGGVEHRGIKITKNEEGEPVLKLGSGKEKSELPVGKAVKEMFEDRAAGIKLIREAIINYENADVVDQELALKGLQAVVVEVTGEDNLDHRTEAGPAAYSWAEEDPDVMILEKADLSTNEPWRIIKERVKVDTALVHFTNESPGQQDLYANVPDEALIECRHPYVRKSYRPFPPAGVLVAGIGTGPRGEQQGLFLMYPRSSFRVHRDEDPPALVVAWPGSTLRCFAPAKYRPAKEQKRKRQRRTSAA
jgi:hypothetical protein